MIKYLYMEQTNNSLFLNKRNNFIDKFFSSDMFLIAYTIFVFVLSLTKRGDITAFCICLSFALVFFLQKDIKPLLIPFTMCYFAFPFIVKNAFPMTAFIPVGITILAISIIFYVVKNKPKLKFTTTYLFTIPYAIAYILGGLFTDGFIENKTYVVNLGLIAILSLVFLFFALIAGNSKTLDLEYAMKIIFALGVLMILQIYTKAFFDTDFLETFKKDLFKLNWGKYNGIVTVLLFAIPSCFYFIKKYPSKLVIFAVIAFLLLIGGILTASRAAMISVPVYFIICVIVSAFVVERKYLSAYLLTFIFLFLSVLAFLYVVQLKSPDVIQDVINTIYKSGFESNGRITLWKESIRMFLESPIFGKGLLHDSVDTTGLENFFWQSHNTVLQTMSSLGLVGLCGLLLHTFAKYRACCKKGIATIFVLMMFIGTEIYGLIDCLMPSPYYVIPLLTLMITLDVIPKKEQNALPLDKNG